MTSSPVGIETSPYRQGATPAPAALAVEGLRVETTGGAVIVDEVVLNLRPGEILGVVGESGSGKTTTARALLGYSDPGTVIAGGTVHVGGRLVVGPGTPATRELRGSAISYVPQNPGTALNPSMRVGAAVRSVLRAHRDDRHRPAADPDGEIRRAFRAAGLPDDDAFLRRYPHQLSGGQKQRVCIATALACQPGVVVLDEPTTGLDVVTQATILDELRRLAGDQQVAMVYITHDLAAVARVATRLAVMYAGRVVETGPTEAVLRLPQHPYTRGLMRATPDHVAPAVLIPLAGVAVGVGGRPAGCSFCTRCPSVTDACRAQPPARRELPGEREVRCLQVDEVAPLPREPVVPTDTPGRRRALLRVANLRLEYGSGSSAVPVTSDVAFTVGYGEIVALVGESGSGKTTLGRAVAGLHPPAAGNMGLAGERLVGPIAYRTPEQRRRIQIVFQDSSDALNPRHTVRASISRAGRVVAGLGRAEADRRAEELLDLVRLPRRAAGRYPRELSGGERQRVAVARALITSPALIVCDEITSALDVSIQAAVLDLLLDLRRELDLALLFITHDFGVVASLADRVLVLRRGVVCESGPVTEVLHHPRHEYTRGLLAAAPSLSDPVPTAGVRTLHDRRTDPL